MSETRDEMTLERACEILTEHQHRNGRWRPLSGSAVCCYGDVIVSELTGFEAITVAAAYQPAPAAPPRGAAEGDGDAAMRRNDMPQSEALAAAVGVLRGALASPHPGDLWVANFDGFDFHRAAALSRPMIDALLAAAEARPELNVTIGERDVADELAGAFAELMGGRVVGVTRDGEAEAPTLRSQVMALAALKDGWYDGEGAAYDPKRLAAVAGLLERLAGIATGQVYPVPSGLSEPSGLIRVEWGDRPRDDSLEIDPVTLGARMHLYDLDSGETLIGEIMPESLAEARPRVGEATRKVLATIAETIRIARENEGCTPCYVLVSRPVTGVGRWLDVELFEAALKELDLPHFITLSMECKP